MCNNIYSIWNSCRSVLLKCPLKGIDSNKKKVEQTIKKTFKWDSQNKRQDEIIESTHSAYHTHITHSLVQFWNYININYTELNEIYARFIWSQAVKYTSNLVYTHTRTHSLALYCSVYSISCFQFDWQRAAVETMMMVVVSAATVLRSSNRLVIIRYQRHILIKIDMYSIENEHTNNQLLIVMNLIWLGVFSFSSSPCSFL